MAPVTRVRVSLVLIVPFDCEIVGLLDVGIQILTVDCSVTDPDTQMLK
jgi:hypothetical protein